MSLILRHLQTSPALSRTRLARETGLSKATVSTLVAELCSRGLLVEEEPDLSGNVGRPSTGLRTAPRTAAGIGLEISGASLLLSITDLTGEVIERRCELVDDAGHHPETMIEHVAAMLSQALEQLTQQGTTVPGIVLAQPGIIDYADNTKFADQWLRVAPGTDGALAQAMGHVILKEFHVGKREPMFLDYMTRYTDSPFLVEIGEVGEGNYGFFLKGIDITWNVEVVVIFDNFFIAC